MINTDGILQLFVLDNLVFHFYSKSSIIDYRLVQKNGQDIIRFTYNGIIKIQVFRDILVKNLLVIPVL